ncbi:MAG: enoyl-CoA hydratase/isomerase family protein [Thermodesulfobacteriota bacterium]
MSNVDFKLDESVAVLTMNSGENRFNPDFLNALRRVLDTIETETEARTLIVTSGHEKIFSNGLDLDWLVPVIQKQDSATAKSFFYLLMDTFKRVATYPLLTIAALSGHAFAGGAIFSCAFDYRFMRADRGFFCFPEVDLGIPFLPGMMALLKKAIPYTVLEDMVFSGRRLTAEECRTNRIVRTACPMPELLPEALAFAKSLNKKRSTVAEMKKRMNKPIVDAIEKEDPVYIESGVFHV